jgi:rhomboid protease GluP
MDFSAVFTMVFLSSAWVAETICQKDKKRKTPTLTLTVCGLLTICLVAQLRFPHLLILLQRNTAKIVVEGEWWRILTALFLQDGWVIGGLTNIVALFFIGSLVEQVRSRRDWLLISIVGALVTECVALRWQPIGAGNSIATCSLAGSLIALRPLSQTPARSKILRIVAITSCLVLVATGDVHGIAGMVGIFLGLLLSNTGRLPNVRFFMS